MAAGLATLRELERSDAYARLEATGAALQQGFERALARHREPASVVRVGSIVWIALQPGPAPRAYAALAPRAAERLGELHRPLLEAGLWLAPSAYEVAFASTAHGPEHVARAVEALDVALARSGARTR
jgi:glutamate-1-semialdehyde 2,1-aminomutase